MFFWNNPMFEDIYLINMTIAYKNLLQICYFIYIKTFYKTRQIVCQVYFVSFFKYSLKYKKYIENAIS